MFDWLLQIFQDSSFTLWGPFILLLVCGLGVPVPEDIILITAGALSVADGRHWFEVAAIMYIAVLGGDSLVFLVGKHLGRRVRNSRWVRKRIFTPRKQMLVQRKFDQYGTIVLFVGRFLPGLRTPIFFTAGSMKVPYWKFLTLDGFAALISAPVFVWIVHWLWIKFSDNEVLFQEALKKTNEWTTFIVVAIALLGLIALLLRIRSNHRRRILIEKNTSENQKKTS